MRMFIRFAGLVVLAIGVYGLTFLVGRCVFKKPVRVLALVDVQNETEAADVLTHLADQRRVPDRVQVVIRKPSQEASPIQPGLETARFDAMNIGVSYSPKTKNTVIDFLAGLQDISLENYDLFCPVLPGIKYADTYFKEMARLAGAYPETYYFTVYGPMTSYQEEIGFRSAKTPGVFCFSKEILSGLMALYEDKESLSQVIPEYYDSDLEELPLSILVYYMAKMVSVPYFIENPKGLAVY